MRALVLVSLVAAAGCGQVNPCANHTGVCVALRIEGNVKNLDQLAVTVDKPSSKTVATPVQAITLPVAIALDLPAGAGGTVDIGVAGLAHGSETAIGSTSAVISGGHGSATVTLVAHVGGVLDLAMVNASGDMAGAAGSGDMTGIGQGSSDMAGCGAVSACVNADNCCPANCNNNNDSDCPIVCGNNVTESGEVCDDGNTTAGDGCDPTCQWHDKLDLVSGTPGGDGHADGSNLVTRYAGPTGIAYDATNAVLYVANNNDCTIRKLTGTLTGSAATVTVAGSAWDCGTTDGTLAKARFTNMFDIEFLGNALYVAQPSSSSVRKIDLAAGMVTTPITGIVVRGVGHFGALLAYYDTTNGLRTYNPTSGAITTVAPLSSFIGAAGSQNESTECGHPACDATYCYVPCVDYVVRVTMSNGAATNFAGNGATFTPGCASVTATTLTATPFAGASYAATDGAGNVFVSDYGCDIVVKLTASQGIKYAGGGAPPYVDGVADSSANFDVPGGLAWVPSDGLYMIDEGYEIVRRITTFVFTGSGVPSQLAENLASTPPVYAGSSAVAIASDGTNAYTIDSGGRLLKITQSTGAVAVLPLTSPAAWPDPGSSFVGMVIMNGTLYAANTDGVIQSVKTDGTGAAVFAGTIGTPSPPGDGKGAAATLNPIYLATDGKSIFFNDSGKEVRSIDAMGNVHTIAGLSTSVDYMDGTGSGAHFLRATALTSIDGKYVYIGDASNASVRDGPGATAIRRVELATQIVTTIAGSSSMTGHLDGTAKSALFNTISALATDGVSLFVADTDYTTFGSEKGAVSPSIRQLDLATMNVTTMIGMPGQWSFDADTGTAARVHFPSSLTFEPTTHSMFFFDVAEKVFARIK